MQEKQIKELELWNRYKSGDNEAKKELIFSLKPLINSQVNKYRGSGLPPISIELEGIDIASNAIDTYDPSRSQLNTHVVNNLKKLSRFVTNYQNIGHIPESRVFLIGKYNAIFENLTADLGREPTVFEIADAMSIPPVEVERLQTELRKDLILEIPGEDDNKGFFMYARPEEEDPRFRQAREFVYFDADSIDKKILEYTFGLGGAPKLKFNEIVKKLKISDSNLKKRKKELAKKINELI